MLANKWWEMKEKRDKSVLQRANHQDQYDKMNNYPWENNERHVG